MLASRKSSDFEMDTDKSFSVRWYGQYHGQTGRNRITSCLPTIRSESQLLFPRTPFERRGSRDGRFRVLEAGSIGDSRLRLKNCLARVTMS